MIDTSTDVRSDATRRVLSAICICVMLVGVSAFVPASHATTPDDEITYSGEAVVHHAGEVYLWHSAPVQIRATVAGVEKGSSVCLERRAAHTDDTRRVECIPVDSRNTAASTSVQFDLSRWPDPGAGTYVVVIGVRPSGDGNGTRRVASDRVVVMRKNGDRDVDGLTNIAERRGETNFTDSDTDDDGLLDGSEVTEYGTSPVEADTDGDGIRDGVEIMFGTDPRAEADQTNGSRFGNAITDRSGTTDRELADGPVKEIHSGEGIVHIYLGTDGRTNFSLGGIDLFVLVAALLAGLIATLRYTPGTAERLGLSWGRDPGNGAVDEHPRSANASDGIDTTVPTAEEKRVLQLLREREGRMNQATIVDETGWPKSKVSRLLSRLDASGRIRKEREGRRNLILLNDEQG